MPTLTIIISLIILAVYIFLLVANKSNPKTNGMLMVVPVSYTHLTLPTTERV